MKICDPGVSSAFVMESSQEMSREVRELAIYLFVVVYRMFQKAHGKIQKISHEEIIALSLEYVFLQPSSGDSGPCLPIPMDNSGMQAKSQTALDLACRKGFVVYPGDESYPLGKNVFVLSIKELGRMTAET